ncbi:MAG: hypothetical protein H0W29_08650 [Gemmatimonadales bacterium]|nr:hypothetical protein [Gemmatimonadales bacterium]
MSPPHKPQDYTSVSPYLIVDGASGTIEFLSKIEARGGDRRDVARPQHPSTAHQGDARGS